MASDTIETREPPPPSSLGDRRGDRSARVWFLVLVVGLIAAAPFLLWWGRKQWFFLDEWSFLVNRRLTDIPSMLRAHNSHWVTFSAVEYRVLFRFFGLRYFPYQFLTVLLHLGVIVMMWFTMRRLQVRPMIATITALPFVLYGAGYLNILFGFQTSLTGSIVFGLAQLLLATADAPTVRRDVVGVLLGLGAVMCSAVGIPMVIGVAAAVLIRRGWRAAAMYTVPLGVVYVAWYVAYSYGEQTTHYSLGADTFSFAWDMVEGAFVGFGQNGFVAVALALVAAVGVASAVQAARSDRHGEQPAIVAALIGSAVAFALLTAFGRVVFDPNAAASDRYIYVVAALCLPVVALGAEVLARYRVVLGAIPLVLLAIGLPDNVAVFRDPDPYRLGLREQVTAAAYSPLLDQLPSDSRLFSSSLAPELAPTAGFLRAAVADGRLPALHKPSQRLRLDADAQIALDQTGERSSRVCPAATTVEQQLHATRGTRIRFSGTIVIAARRGTAVSFPLTFDSRNGGTIEVRAGPLDLAITGVGQPPAICRIQAA